MTVLNLTQHPATAEQRQAGIIDLPEAELQQLRMLLTFEELPSRKEILSRASAIAALAAVEAETENGLAFQAMIGGAPFLMAPLEEALREQGLDPVYAFSRRESAEQTQADGSIRKVNVFRHVGLIYAEK